MEQGMMMEDFQNMVSELLIRHRSILDILTKSQEAVARVNRAVVKAVTTCGCLKINAGHKKIPGDLTINDLRKLLDSNLSGKMCDSCREAVEAEMGRTLFYLAALCNATDLNLLDIMLKEEKRLKMLGVYNLS